MIRKMLLTLALIGVLLTAFGCNTVAGLGRDISTVGNALSDAAHDAVD